MVLYLTKVWGFSDPSGPLSFNSQGARNTARSKLQDGDLVVNVGTLGGETLESERGRVLGIMQPTKEVVSALDFDLNAPAGHFDDAGNYRWPFGLTNLKAWILDEPRPLLVEITARRFYMDAATGIVPLEEAEATRILGYPRREVELLLPTRTLTRLKGFEAARKRGAPPPTTSRTGVMHMRRAPAQTYLMSVGRGFKIGWAFEAHHRERQFNLAAMPSLGGLEYKVRLVESWDTAREAYDMEQALLKKFDANRHPRNREILDGVRYTELEKLWVAYLMSKRRK